MINRRQASWIVFTTLLVFAGGCNYSQTAVVRQVGQPRPGRLLRPPSTQPSEAAPSGVAIIYSQQADINLKGAWEQLGPTDPHKGRKILHQLLAAGAIAPEDVFVPAPADDADLLAVHTRHYLDSLSHRQVVAEIVGSEYPLWQSRTDHVERIVGGHRAAVGGTILAAELAAAHGLAIHLGGGFTHAFADRGGNGSLLADIPVAIVMLRQRKLARRVMVVDLSACQANGVAGFLANDADAYLLDIYESNNYPPTKQPMAGGIAIPDGLGDGEYRMQLDGPLVKALDSFRPELVFLVAGADVVAGDPAGRSALTPAGILSRDLFVAEQVRGRKIPLCVVLGTGGSDQAWQLHYRTIRGLLARYGGVPFRAGE